MEGCRKIAGACLSLLVALAAISFCSCDLKEDILHSCRSYMQKNMGTPFPPSHSLCCQNINKANMEEICHQLTAADKESIEMYKFVTSAKVCGKDLPVGYDCSGYRVLAAPSVVSL
jgi:hypothetical protein